jgi:hypothetical protein
MDIVSQVVASIRSANISAELYRTARELLDLVGDNGQVKISKQAMMDICHTESDGTMRRQLGSLKKAGIIHFSTNDFVHVSFVGFPTVDEMITGRAPTRVGRAPTRGGRAPVITGRAENDESDPAGNAYDDDEMITGRAPTRARRAPVITGRALPHTRSDRLIDRSSNLSSEEINQSIKHAPTGPQRTPRQPWEAPLSYRLLTDNRIAMRRADAERLADAHPFHSIRDAVAHWWANRKSAGGRFEDYPGIVVYWLDNPDETVIPVMADEYTRGELYRDYRTPDELAAAAADEASQAQPPAAEHRHADPAPAEPEPGTPAAHWQQIVGELATEQGGSFGRWVHDTQLVAHEEETNTYTIGLPDAFRYDWIVNRLSKQINRKLAVITGRKASTEFIVTGSVSRETQGDHA